jgi:hypothetical protein
MNKSAGLIAKSLLIDSDNIFSKFSGEEIYGTLGKASENIRIKENEYEEIVINHDGSVTHLQ